MPLNYHQALRIAREIGSRITSPDFQHGKFFTVNANNTVVHNFYGLGLQPATDAMISEWSGMESFEIWDTSRTTAQSAKAWGTEILVNSSAPDQIDDDQREQANLITNQTAKGSTTKPPNWVERLF